MAALHGAVIALLCAAVGAIALAGPQGSVGPVLAVAAADLALAVGVALAPGSWWEEQAGQRNRPLLAATLLLAIGATGWATDGYASGTSPLVVLVFTWLGLHCRPRVVAVMVPWAAVMYGGGLVLADAPGRLVASTAVLIPIASVVSLLIANRVVAATRLRERLERRELWRAALIATLAHDVRSPLATVSGTLEMLEDDPCTDDRYRPLLAAAIRQSTRVARLASGILEVERVEDGRLVLDRQDVDLLRLGADVATLTQPTQVEIRVPEGLTAWADRERLEQVVYNLVNNALRHGRPPVVVSAERTAVGVDIAIEDQGSGVPRADVGVLFERFSGADRSPDSVGLGLWIVQTLVDAHGGVVRYEAPRGGARFVVSLPDRIPSRRRSRVTEARTGCDGTGRAFRIEQVDGCDAFSRRPPRRFRDAVWAPWVTPATSP